MDGQHQTDDRKNGRTVAVRDSVKKLKAKFVPGVKYSLLISAAINFAMLVVGCVNVHKCPVNKNVPLFLIATGAIGLVAKFVSYVRDRISKHVQVQYIESALYSVELIFFILGTYWVYKEFQPSYEPSDEKLYCNKTAYLFSFIYITFYYALAIVMLTGFCCFICCAIWLASTQTESDVEAQSTDPPDEAGEALNSNKEVEVEPHKTI